MHGTHTRGPCCGWIAGSLAITGLLLVAVWMIAVGSVPDPTGLAFPGLSSDPLLSQVGHIVFRNELVLALHAMVCVAGFIAGSSLPLQAQRHSGLWRSIHERAGPVTIAFVIGATGFSLGVAAAGLGCFILYSGP